MFCLSWFNGKELKILPDIRGNTLPCLATGSINVGQHFALNLLGGIQKLRWPFFCPILTTYLGPTSGWHVYQIGLLVNIDIWRTTYLPPHVSIAFERPLRAVNTERLSAYVFFLRSIKDGSFSFSKGDICMNIACLEIHKST